MTCRLDESTATPEFSSFLVSPPTLRQKILPKSFRITAKPTLGANLIFILPSFFRDKQIRKLSQIFFSETLKCRYVKNIHACMNLMSKICILLKSNHIFQYTCCVTPTCLSSLRVRSPRHLVRVIQFLSKKSGSAGVELMAKLCLL